MAELFSFEILNTSFTYGKKEKTKSRKQTECLFEQGRSINVFPLRIFYMPVAEPMDFALKAGMSVSSRNFKKAAARNRIKRLLREAYRTEKNILVEELIRSKQQLVCFIIYTDKGMPSLHDITPKMKIALQKLSAAIHENSASNT